MSFYYAPKVSSIADPYTNYNSGGVKFVINEPNLVQFKQDTDEAFRGVMTEISTLRAEIHTIQVKSRALNDENITLARILQWINSHYPEAIHALETTMKVTVKFDEAEEHTLVGAQR